MKKPTTLLRSFSSRLHAHRAPLARRRPRQRGGGVPRRGGGGGGGELAKCFSNLRKLGERALLDARQQPAGGGEEALSGARAVAVLAVGALGAALAFRSRRGASGLAVAGPAAGACGGKAVAQWGCAFQEVQRQVREEYDRRRKEGVPYMAELDAAAAAARAVRCAVAGGGRCPETLAAARRRCDELEETLAVFEENLGELHRELIGVRIVQLEWAQRARGH